MKMLRLMALCMVATAAIVQAESSMTETIKAKIVATWDTYKIEFFKGFVAGAAATQVVDGARKYILPDMPSLYTKYGICRDKLAGMSTMSLASLATTLYNKYVEEAEANCVEVADAYSARIAGVFFGFILSTVAKNKIVG